MLHSLADWSRFCKEVLWHCRNYKPLSCWALKLEQRTSRGTSTIKGLYMGGKKSLLLHNISCVKACAGHNWPNYTVMAKGWSIVHIMLQYMPLYSCVVVLCHIAVLLGRKQPWDLIKPWKNKSHRMLRKTYYYNVQGWNQCSFVLRQGFSISMSKIKCHLRLC